MSLLKNCYNNIKRHKESFCASIYSMFVVFILINLLVFGVFSLNRYKKENLDSNQILIYLNTLSDEEKEKIQKDLLNVNGVISLRYESKEKALEAVSKELGIELSKDENPINDAIFAYIDDDVDLDQLKNKLDSFAEISDVDLRTSSIEANREINHNLSNFITISFVIITLFGISMINYLSSSAVKSREKHIAEELLEGTSERNIQTEFFVETILSFFISYVLSYFVYEKLKSLILNLMMISSNSFVKSNKEEFYTALITLLISILISAFVNYYGLRRYYVRNRIKEEIKEEAVEEIVDIMSDTDLSENKEEELDKG